MEALPNRIDSFAKSKRVKGSKSSRSAPKWPHPPTFKANPESLAEAGFYFNPSLEDKDNVCCFECGKQLSEWEEDDDPFELHWTKCGDKCSWAAVRCGLRGDMDRHGRFTFPDKSRLPGSKRMEKARLGTFNVGDGWVHDQTKGHSANSRKMAQAGFVWTPQVPGDDLTTCLYCNLSLSGWEEEDDPMEEHRKRAKSCPFLAHSSGSRSSSATQTTTASQTTNKLTRSTSAKPPSKVQAKPPSRSRSSRQTRGHKELVIVTDLEEEEDNGVKHTAEEIEDEISDIPTVRLVQKPAEAQRMRKNSRAPSARPSTRGATRAAPQPIPDTGGRSQGRSKALKNVQEEEESSDEIAHCISAKEETGRQLAPSRPRALRKPTKARAKSTSRQKQEEVITQDESEDLGASNRRKIKGHENRVVEETDAEDDIQPVEGGEAHVEKEESGTDATQEEGNATNYGMSEQEDEEERRAPSSSRSTTKASKRSSRAPSANASRRKKGANGARQRGPKRAEEENRDGVVGDDDTVYFSGPGNEEERTPVQRPRVPVSEKFKPVRSPRKEVHGLDSVKPAVVVETTSSPVVVEKRTSDATPPPTELLALNFEDTPIVEERTAVVPVSPSPSSVPTVETLSSSSPALLVMTVEATTPEPQILAPPTMTAKATTPEPQVLSALPIVTANATTAEPQTFPALSRIPFMPLQTLTDAELDMTVEEWIRYQMEIEYDKLKRDGERELARFKARAVEARRIIESL